MTTEEAEKLSEEKLAAVLADAVKSKAAALPEALAKSKNKAVARAAKKALYQLKSSGVAVAVQAPQGEQPKIARDVSEMPALLSVILGTGERALFFVKARPHAAGLDMYQAIIHDELGVQQLDRGDTKRATYTKHLETIRGSQPNVLEVPLERALEELGIAWAVNARAKAGMSPEMESNLRRLGVVAIEKWPDLPPPEAADAALTARAGNLHDEPELTSWLPGQQGIQMLSARLDEVDTGLLQLSEAQKHESRMQKVALTAAELTLEQRRLYAHRLWRMAEVFERTGRADQGKVARAEARLLFHDAKAPSKFIEKTFEKIVMLADQARAKQAAEQSGGALPAPPEKTTPGGLIVP